MLGNMSKHPDNFHKKQNRVKFIPWRSHHCGISGHTRPYCWDLHGHPEHHLSPKPYHTYTKNWNSKDNKTCHVVHLKSRISENWYFNNGCSRHMIGNKHYLGDISYK